METVETSGKTLDEALARAAEQLGLPREALSYEILSEPKRLLGVIGSGHYTVRARAMTEEEIAAAQEDVIEEQAPEAPASAAPAAPVLGEDLSAEGIAERARAIAKHVLDLMGLESQVTVQSIEGENLELAVASPESQGLLIGHHGDTLDALQYLVTIGANRGIQGNAYRVSLDVEGYRARQAEQLIQLAQRHADEALASGQEAVMPGLKAYERRIVHLALVERDDIETYSEGEGPSRQLVISPLTGGPAPDAPAEE